MKKVPWFIVGGLVLVVLILGVYIALTNSGPSTSGTIVETNETQTITYLEKNREIALVNLGISEIIDEKHSQTLFGFDVPWSERQTFIKATFTAKLGIDGRNVVIKQIGENEYEVIIQKFIFIGYDRPVFEHVVDNNGVLSFVTDDVNQTEMITNLLSPENQEAYIDNYTDLLKEATEDFYNNLIPSFAKDVRLTFVYEE